MILSCFKKAFSYLEGVLCVCVCVCVQLKQKCVYDVKTIVQSITQGARNELEQLRAIWVWLCNNIGEFAEIDNPNLHPALFHKVLLLYLSSFLFLFIFYIFLYGLEAGAKCGTFNINNGMSLQSMMWVGFLATQKS
ncbi:hypothetical protein ILYODFUR_002104 [Ilyodon furcidens]|uniref:Uncharacterized protein n=1 Tax=Ilyodon furcidens TaxID=33524 RepID=A0ABV0T4K8_9TELE